MQTCTGRMFAGHKLVPCFCKCPEVSKIFENCGLVFAVSNWSSSANMLAIGPQFLTEENQMTFFKIFGHTQNTCKCMGTSEHV